MVAVNVAGYALSRPSGATRRDGAWPRRTDERGLYDAQPNRWYRQYSVQLTGPAIFRTVMEGGQIHGYYSL